MELQQANEMLLNLIALFNLQENWETLQQQEFFDLWHKVKCPFHEDENPSGSIIFDSNEEDNFVGNGRIKCFNGCKSMSLLEFMEWKEANMGGTISWEDLKSKVVHNDPQSKTTSKQVIFSTDDSVRHFVDFLKEKGLKPETIKECGGALVQDSTDWRYGYLCFSYGYKNKQTVGRKILPVEGERFLNGKGAKSLFGNHSNFDRLILVEGLTDYLAMRQAGYNDVCTSLGAQLSDEQAYQLRRKDVYIIFDRDAAGFKGAKAAYQKIKDFGGNPIILELPDFFQRSDEKVDVCEAIKNDPVIFREWLYERLSRYSTYDDKYTSDSFFRLANLRYFKTQIPSFDAALGGGLTSGIHAFAGVPKIGKSTFCIDLACHLREGGAKVLLCSYELTKRQLWSRIASRSTNHDKQEFGWQSIEKNPQTYADDDHMKKYLKYYGEKIKIVNDFTIEEVKAAAIHFDVFIIDYLQRMKTKGEDIKTGIKNNLNEMTTLVNEAGKIFILISEIPRSQYHSTDGLDIFKETGAIEYCIQSGTKLVKVGENHIRWDVLANTRGVTTKIMTRVNYGHQYLEECEFTEPYGTSDEK